MEDQQAPRPPNLLPEDEREDLRAEETYNGTDALFGLRDDDGPSIAGLRSNSSLSEAAEEDEEMLPLPVEAAASGEERPPTSNIHQFIQDVTHGLRDSCSTGFT